MVRRAGFFQLPPSVEDHLKAIKGDPNLFWRKGQRLAWRLFRFTAATVPAYQQFLIEHQIDADSITSSADWQKLPVTDKDVYLKKYPYHSLFPYGQVEESTTVSATSGTSGEPFYFPRTEEHDRRHDHIFECFLKNQFDIDRKKTLAIIGFGLGIWIGGILNYRTFNRLSQKYPITVAPIGVNKELILRTIRQLGQYYDQIIVCGYPPFIKDLADIGPEHGVQWQQYRMRVICAAEGFSEAFRRYLGNALGIGDVLNDITNIYGTVELGAMAHETAVANLIRELAMAKATVFRALFPEAHRLPTLAQYHPDMIWFEEVAGEVVATGSGSAIPLIRYRFPDRGGVLQFPQMVEQLRHAGVDLFQEAEKHGLLNQLLQLPFVYIYERSDLAATLVGILIYPEYIKNALQHRQLTPTVTGKFTMQVVYDAAQNQVLEIHVELKHGVRANGVLREILLKSIIASLLHHSSEYHHLYYQSAGEHRARLEPVVVLHPYEAADYFKAAGKHRWLIKTS